MSNVMIGTAISGLNAAQLGLATASHNISNAATPGYNRQETVQSANTPQAIGVGYIGQGVNVASVRRVYDDFLETQIRYVQTQSSEYDTHYTQIKRINDLLADPESGLTPALEAFFSAMQDVANRPGDAAARQGLLSASQTLGGRFQDLDRQLTDARDAANEQIRSSVVYINTLGTQIAQLNQQIALATNGSGQQLPNDLLDRRDALIRDLSKETNTTVVKQTDGSVSVFIGSGQSLVTGERTFQLVAIANALDSRDAGIGIQTGSSIMKLRSADLSGGNLAGYLTFRDESVVTAQNSLGRIARVLADQINTQHRLGQDRNGVLGGDFFALAPPVAASNTGNSGSAVLAATISDATQLTGSDYRVQFDGANYDITRLSDNTTQSFAGLPQTIDGVTIQLSSGVPASNDTFLIQPTRTAAMDLRVLINDTNKIVAAAPILAGASVANLGSGRISLGEVITSPPNPNLQQPVTITFTSATTYSVTGTGTGNPVGLAYTSGQTISYNGWQLTLDGNPALGDAFSVQANVGGVGDNRNALKLAQLQTQPIVANGTTTLQGAFAQLVSGVGNKTRELEVSSRAQANLVELTEQAKQSLSGVNLDEEAAKLIRYQQAYQAAGKVIAIAGTLFDTILGLQP